MKKLLVLSLVFATGMAQAKLSEDCRNSMIRVHEQYQTIQQGIASGEIDDELADYFLKANDDSAEIVALTCAGIKKIELERTLLGRIGLVSHKKASKKAAEVRQEALAFYESLKNN